MRNAVLVVTSATHAETVTPIVLAAGGEPVVVPDLAAARRAWARARLVVVGDDVIGGTDLPRRAGVVLLGVEPQSPEVWRRAVEIGAEQVVSLPGDADWLVMRIADAVQDDIRRGRVVGVLGGRGGAGASVVAASLAVVAARRGLRTALVDADPLGGGIELLLAADGAAGPRWPDLLKADGPPPSAAALLAALPHLAGVGVVSWPPGADPPSDPDVVRRVVILLQRVADLVVVDLPRGDIGVAPAWGALDVVVLVVPGDVRSVAAASSTLAQVQRHAADVRLVVRGPLAPALDADEIAAILGIPLCATVRWDPRLPRLLDRGELPATRGRGALASSAAALLTALGLPAGDPAAA